jgi:hypothetical protein
MDIDELKEKLSALKQRGYVVSMRRGNTGIGYTLETLLGVDENNLQLPDLGGIELKAQRSGTTSLITLFTFNRGAWKMKQAEVIEKYGYRDTNDRLSLYSTTNSTPNSQGLFIRIEDEYVRLYHVDGTLIAQWLGEGLARSFGEKMPALVAVFADTRINSDDNEEFWFNEAYLLKQPDASNILELIRNDTIVVDIRMHINDKGSVRNHGTGFRIDENFLRLCFVSREKLS